MRQGARAVAAVVAVTAGTCLPALTDGPSAAATHTVRINVFAGAWNLPIFAAERKGFFARHGLTVEVQATPTSAAQRAGLAKGEFEIAHAAVDNAVALVELARVDAVIVMGGDDAALELIVQPDIASLPDLRGKTVIVDAPNTAYALIVKKALLTQGLRVDRDYTVKPTGGVAQRFTLMKEHKEYAGTMLGPPYTILAVRQGLKSLGPTRVLVGPYQGTGAFVLRSWARANAATLERYIAAYVEALRWARANRGEAIALLGAELALPDDVAATTYDAATAGMAPDARFDMEGFKNVLAIRAATEGTWGGTPPPPETYLDLTYYERTIAALPR